MTEKTASPGQIVLGLSLGLLLQPLALSLGVALWRSFHPTNSSDRSLEGLEYLFLIALHFGAMQALTIVPAALLFYRLRKIGIVYGLLYFGLFLATCNILLWMFTYKKIFYPPIY